MKLDLERQGPGRTYLDLSGEIQLDWGAERPARASVQGRLQVDNLDRRFLMSGELDACGRGECARCLEPCEIRWQAPVEFMVLRDLDTDEGQGDSMVILQQTGEVDLREVIRESLLLAFPQAPLCRDSCRGLCPHCGINRNDGRCDCEETPTDPRWEGLP
jgi:uncharacterized protein